MQDKSSVEVPSKPTDKNVIKLLTAIDKVYGSTWRLAWRNFLAGLMHALGATIGYVLFIGLAILIADKLGVFDSIQNFWQGLLKQLPFQSDSALQFKTDILDQ